MLSQAEKDVDDISNLAGCRGLQYEVSNGLTPDGILLVVRGVDNTCDMLKVLDQQVGGEEMVPNEEHEFQEGPELRCLAVAHALGVTTRPESEVEDWLDQVASVLDFWVGHGGSCGHDGLADAQGSRFSPFY